MKIEKVKNGFIVEVEAIVIDESMAETATSVMRGYRTEKYICDGLAELLDFVNTHYSEEPKLKPGKIVEIE